MDPQAEHRTLRRRFQTQDQKPKALFEIKDDKKATCYLCTLEHPLQLPAKRSISFSFYISIWMDLLLLLLLVNGWFSGL